MLGRVIGMKVLVTGGQGFIGSALVRRLLSDREHSLVISVRSRDIDLIEGVDFFYAGELHPDTEWAVVLKGVDVVIKDCLCNSFRHSPE